MPTKLFKYNTREGFFFKIPLKMYKCINQHFFTVNYTYYNKNLKERSDVCDKLQAAVRGEVNYLTKKMLTENKVIKIYIDICE